MNPTLPCVGAHERAKHALEKLASFDHVSPTVFLFHAAEGSTSDEDRNNVRERNAHVPAMEESRRGARTWVGLWDGRGARGDAGRAGAIGQAQQLLLHERVALHLGQLLERPDEERHLLRRAQRRQMDHLVSGVSKLNEGPHVRGCSGQRT